MEFYEKKKSLISPVDQFLGLFFTFLCLAAIGTETCMSFALITITGWIYYVGNLSRRKSIHCQVVTSQMISPLISHPIFILPGVLLQFPLIL